MPVDTFRRLHPLTPLIRGWYFVAALVAAGGQQNARELGPGRLLAVIAAAAVVGVVYGFLAWRFSRYGIVGGDLRYESGVLFRRSRRVRLDRLQAVDVVQPLLARVLGLAELHLEVAGGGRRAEAPLAFLDERTARALRAELLARAAGVAEGTPEAPEVVVLTVPTGRLAASMILSPWLVLAGFVVLSAVTSATVTGSPGLLGLALPTVFALAPMATPFMNNFGTVVALSPDGIRLRRGLLQTRAQTVPPGRVQAVRLAQPLLWRPFGWWRVQVTVIGYGRESMAVSSLLLPVGTRDDALTALGLVLPGLDLDAVPLVPVPARSRWLGPLGYKRRACGHDAQVFISRRGVLNVLVDLIGHERMQSASISQGPLQRVLRLSTLRLHTPHGPVDVRAPHRDAAQAARLLMDESERSRFARTKALPERWMTGHSDGVAQG